MENIPYVPLMYRPLEFYEFNQSNCENFPTEESTLRRCGRARHPVAVQAQARRRLTDQLHRGLCAV